MTSPTIGFICGSLRSGSINKALEVALSAKVNAAGAAALSVDLADYDLPLFHGDLEAPQNLQALVKLLSSLDGIIIVSPEYNGGLPPVLKNMIDWVSTVAKEPFANPVYGIASCTPGPMSGIMCMRQINYILMRLGAEVMFNEDGELIAQPSANLADKLISTMIARIAQKAA